MDKRIMAIMATAVPTPEQFARITPEQFARIRPTAFAWITPAAFARITPEQFARITPEQFAWITPEQFARITPAALAWIRPEQFARIRPTAFAWITPEQFAWITPEQFAWIRPEQFAWITPEQFARIELARNAPKVEKLYSRIATGIADASRRLDQSTFGPDNDPKTNLCNTPMCVAGHTVNLAGAKGYALAKTFGFELAARLIHRVSRPDVSCPRYDSYPNEWALAYIEERAAEEVA